MNNFDSLAHFWWVRVPAFLARGSRLFSTIAVDGAYLRGWPPVAAFGPLVCLIVGFLSGWLHFSDGLSYTHAIGLMALFVILSGFGAGLGLWLLAGYFLGDFFLFGHENPYDQTLITGLLVMRLSLMIAYVLLAKLVCLTPLVSRGLRQQLLARLKLAPAVAIIANAIVQGALQAVLVWVWVNATPTLIRPIYSWLGGTPPTAAMRPLQQNGAVLVVIAFVIGAARAVLESLPGAQRAASNTRAELDQVQERSRPVVRAPLPGWLTAVLRALFATFMMSGIIDTWFEALAFFLLITGAQLLRGFLATNAQALVEFMGRIPIILRIVIGGLASYLVASVLMPAFWGGGNTFIPVLLTSGTSLLVFSVLMPAAAQRSLEVRA